MIIILVAASAWLYGGCVYMYICLEGKNEIKKRKLWGKKS